MNTPAAPTPPPIKIYDRWSGRVLHEVVADSLRAAVLKLIAAAAEREAGANLSGADLSRADLSRADLSGANLSDADLSRADLSGANLSDADLSRANLSDADLSDADLSRADLSDADLSDADLSRANLSRADLSPIRSDFFAVLDSAPNEVPALLAALQQGRVDGSTYTGECACLVGTIANARGVFYENLGALKPDSSRLAERWFMGIGEGDTPANSVVSKVTETWVLEWQAARATAEGGAS